MSETVIKIDVRANAADYRRVLLWYQWKRQLFTSIVWLIVVLPALYMVSSEAGLIWLRTSKTAPLELFAILMLLPLTMAVNAYFGIWRRAKKIEQISESIKLVFSESGVKSESESTSNYRSWNKFDKVYETKEDFIFFPQDIVFYTVPRRFFSNPSQIEELKDLLKTNLGQRAKLIS